MIPDGTPVHLRFAQPLYGTVEECPLPWKVCDSPRLVKTGQAVRLIVAADVLVNQRLVIAKGSLAEAHVKNAYRVNNWTNRNSQPFDPGFTLVLDWVQAISADRVQLRAVPKGKPHWFSVRIIGSGEGVVVMRNTVKHDMGWIYTGLFNRETYHARNWIPAGARITSYVNLDTKLLAEDMAKAEAELPARNPLAVLTVYRTKGSGSQAINLSCDDRTIGSLHENEYLTAELSAGEHSCRAENAEALKLKVNAGDEVFLHLHNSALSGNWGLKAVEVAEGEDSIAKAQYAAYPTCADAKATGPSQNPTCSSSAPANEPVRQSLQP